MVEPNLVSPARRCLIVFPSPRRSSHCAIVSANCQPANRQKACTACMHRWLKRKTVQRKSDRRRKYAAAPHAHGQSGFNHIKWSHTRGDEHTHPARRGDAQARPPLHKERIRTALPTAVTVRVTATIDRDGGRSPL